MVHEWLVVHQSFVSMFDAILYASSFESWCIIIYYLCSWVYEILEYILRGGGGGGGGVSDFGLC